MTGGVLDWRTLPAGRELDAVVAERVMGLEVRTIRVIGRGGARDEPGTVSAPHSLPGGGEGVAATQLPHYSTDIAAAWVVAEKLRERFWWVRIIAGRDGLWEPAVDCEIGALPTLTGEPSHLIARATADTAPLAIVRAALAATEARP